ncbi:MAG: hypothetical protein GY870_08875 [archaeon]|nr:hypothetical protein [archaeon]
MAVAVNEFPGAVIILLITGVVALIFTIFMVLDYLKNKKIFHLLWAIAFFVVFAAGVILVLTNDFELLLSPIVAVLAAFIPGGIAAGLYFSSIFDEEKSKKLGNIYLIFVIIGAVLIGITKFVSTLSALVPFAVMLVHIPSSLSMIVLPFLTFKNKTTKWTSLLVSLGGLLISLAGVLLAFLTLGSPILDAIQIFTVLPILLLIVSACFAFGFLLTKKWTFAVPFIKID